MRDVRFRPTGWEDLLYRQAADKTLFRKLVRLIGEIRRDPFTGIGKPEPLKGVLPGPWARRSCTNPSSLNCRSARAARRTLAPVTQARDRAPTEFDPGGIGPVAGRGLEDSASGC